METPIIKLIHLATAGVSISFFLYRFQLMVRDLLRTSPKWLKILPHINDTVLLISAITLAFQLQQYPIAQHWLTLKVVGLIAYICFGIVALKLGKNKKTRVISGVLALITFATIVFVAITKPLST